MFLALLSTGHYDFVALGDTREHAERVMHRKCHWCKP